jgi:signal recognition particle GTPase
MFESLSEKIDSALHRLSGRGKITDINIAEAVKDIRRALVRKGYIKGIIGLPANLVWCSLP